MSDRYSKRVRGLEGKPAIEAWMPGRAQHWEADVIVPVFDALPDVRRCIASVLEHGAAGGDLRLILVNDGSGAETTAHLRQVAGEDSRVVLVEHSENRGYTPAINSGLKASSAPFVVLLNSDTIVPAGWLDRLVRCARSDPRIGIVGPLSNAASWQSVPHLRDANGKFAVNRLPHGMGVAAMASLVSEASERRYPRTPFVNGFCFLLTREAIRATGVFDEASFPYGYGEENDYCLRARRTGFEAAIADDCFVFHAKSRSFGHRRRIQLSKAGMVALREKHGDAEVDRRIAEIRDHEALNQIRASVTARLHERLAGRGADPCSLAVLFLLPSKGGNGGANSVVQEAAAMRRVGARVTIAVRRRDREHFCRVYRDVPDIERIVVGVHPSDLLSLAKGFDVVVGTVYTTMADVRDVVAAYPHILPAYYVQDYEPFFFPEGSKKRKRAKESYTLVPGAFLFAKTRWIGRTVERHHGVPVAKVEPSIDHDVFHPAARRERDHRHVVAMVRPQTPRRAAELTMRVLREVSRRHSDRVAIHLFGCSSEDPRFQRLPRDFPFVDYGVLGRGEVASLLRKSDIFVDLSTYQAFGRTALEAMASGCASVVPLRGGADEYAVDGENALVVDSSNEAECVRRISSLIESPARLTSLRNAGLVTAARYGCHRAAMSELVALSRAVGRHRGSVDPVIRPRLVLGPATGDDGQLTARASTRLKGPWDTIDTRSSWDVEIAESTLPRPRADAPGIVVAQPGWNAAENGEFLDWLRDWRRTGGKLIVDVGEEAFEPERAGRLETAEERMLRRERTRWLAKMADMLLVPSSDAGLRWSSLNPSFLVVPSVLCPDLWRLRDGDRLRGRDGKEKRRPIRIGALGDPAEAGELELIQKDVRRLERELGDEISVEVIGAFEQSPPLFGKRIGLPEDRAYADYVDWLHRRTRWDIALLPARDCDDERGRLRYFEYVALGAAVVASDTKALRETIDHERNGLLVRNRTGTWYRALKRLIGDPSLRQRLAREAHDELRVRASRRGAAAPTREPLLEVLSLPRRLDVPHSLEGRVPWQAPEPRTPKSDRQPATPRSTVSSFVVESPAERAVWARKLAKLRRDPEAFFADSGHPVLRGFGRLVMRKR